MKKILLLLAFAALLAPVARASVVKMPLDVPDADCSAPEIASDPDGLTMVAYTARGALLQSFVVVQPMGTRAACADYVGEPQTLAPGSLKKICWTREGFVLAVADGSVIQIFESDLDGLWDTANPTLIQAAGEVTGMDLWGVPSDAAGRHVFLAFEIRGNPPYGDRGVYFASADVYGWNAPEPVAAGLAAATHPAMSWTIGPAGPLPDLYWLIGPEGARQLVHSYRDPIEGWATPLVVPGDGATGPTPFDGPFEVIRHWTFDREILGLGPQPVCPCGTIHHQADDGGGWQPAVEMTADHLTYDWPQSPRLARDDLNRSYAFWMQIASGSQLDERFRTLEYRIREGGEWQDYGSVFADQTGPGLGSSVAIDVTPIGYPVWAWSRRDTIGGEPQPEQIWVARLSGPTPAPQVPRAEAQLTAWPNPFNPRVKLAVDAAAGAHARLEIHDARGRLVVTLLDETLAADRREAAWDGTDRAGRAVPSGVYFARLVCSGPVASGTTVTKLVLAR